MKIYVIKNFISAPWIQLHLLMKIHLLNQKLSIPWIQSVLGKPPFINRNALTVIKNFIPIPWIQPELPFANKYAPA